MKSRMMVSLLVIALAAAVIGGGTMAWFTDEAASDPVTFTAGTVDIEVGLGEMPNGIGNVNPGDCFDVNATIKNNGSKNVVLKLDDITGAFNLLGDVDMSLVSINFQDANTDDWRQSADGKWLIVFKGEAEDDYHNLSNYVIYYRGAPIVKDESVTLALKVCFDGPKMDDDYQGATFTLNGTFYAIQASNNAPYYEWGTDLYGTPAY